MEHYIQSTGAPGDREREFHLLPECYPEPVTEAILRVKHVERSDSKTSVTYEEDWGGVTWTCRWGRHSNDHNDRDHFHHPPSPDKDTDPYAYDADLARGVLLMETPIEFILARMNDLAISDQLTYPSDYEWTMDYQQGKYHAPDGSNSIR